MGAGVMPVAERQNPRPVLAPLTSGRAAKDARPITLGFRRVDQRREPLEKDRRVPFSGMTRNPKTLRAAEDIDAERSDVQLGAELAEFLLDLGEMNARPLRLGQGAVDLRAEPGDD
jgi:hypothetical protein